MCNTRWPLPPPWLQTQKTGVSGLTVVTDQEDGLSGLTMVADPEDGVFGLSVHLPLPALLRPELLILISTALHKLQILPISDHKFGCFKCRDSTNENIIVIKLLSALL